MRPESCRHLQRQPPNGQVRLTTLVEGGVEMTPDGRMNAIASVVLLQSDGHNILFDTPTSTDTPRREQMLNGRLSPWHCSQ